MIPNVNAIYDFSTQVVLPESNQVLVGRVGHGGVVDGRWHLNLAENLQLRMNAALQGNKQQDTYQVEEERSRKDFLWL